MSGYRSSFVFSKEDSFKGGLPKGGAWIAPPPGSFISTTHNRSVEKIYSAGSKFFDTVAYGQMSGSFEWTFLMDYDYMEPFFLAFEDVDCEYVAAKDSTPSYIEYTFNKSNGGRVPSFTIRRKTLNRIAGGPENSDETIIYRGCVVKTVRFSKAAGASQINVTMSGFYAEEALEMKALTATDYQPYDGHQVEFSCMFVDSVSEDNYVANTESLSLGIENSASAVFSTCTPFASEYAEGQSSFTFGTTCYSNDPVKYKLRLYGGGKRATEYKDNWYRPGSKGMAPIDKVYLASYSAIMDPEFDGDASNDKVASTIDASSYRAIFELSKVVIKSLTWQKGDGSKLQDQINSVEVQRVQLSTRFPGTGAYCVKGEDGSSTCLDATTIWSSANPHALPE